MAVAPRRPVTVTTRLVSVGPTPICPRYGLGLWHSTLPPATIAQVCSVCWPSSLKLNAFRLVKPRTTFGGEEAAQHSATLRTVRAHAWNGSPLTVTASASPRTSFGVSWSPASSTGPSRLLQPQQLTVPFACSAQACWSPVPTAVMSSSPGTTTGVGLLTRVPLPSSPLALSPQHATVWSASTAHALDVPA